MSRYTDLADWVAPLSGIRYITTKPVIWEIGRKGSGLVYEVPSNTIFDVSIPKVFRWLLSPHNPKFLKAACIHDTMLLAGWSGVTAGAEFNQALKADGVPAWKRFFMYLAVVLYHWS